MPGQPVFPARRRPAAAAALLLAFSAVLGFPNSPRVAAAAPGEAKADRTPAGKSVSAKGMILRREGGPGAKWLDVDDKETLYTGDLLLGLPGARLESSSRAAS